MFGSPALKLHQSNPVHGPYGLEALVSPSQPLLLASQPVRHQAELVPVHGRELQPQEIRHLIYLLPQLLQLGISERIHILPVQVFQAPPVPGGSLAVSAKNHRHRDALHQGSNVQVPEEQSKPGHEAIVGLERGLLTLWTMILIMFLNGKNFNSGGETVRQYISNDNCIM